MTLNRRGFLGGLIAAAGAPLAGKFVIDQPRILAGGGTLALPDKPLIITPQSEPLVIATEMPMAAPSRSLRGWVKRWTVDIDHDYVMSPGGLKAGMIEANLSLEMALSGPVSLDALHYIYGLDGEVDLLLVPVRRMARVRTG